MRVLRIVVGLDPAFGGPSESAVSQCLATQAAGVENTLVYLFQPGVSGDNEIARSRLNAAGVVTRRFPITRIAGAHSQRWAVSAALSRWTLSATRRFDIVHLHQAWGAAQIIGFYGARWTKRPCVLTPHESLTDYDIRTSTAIPPWIKKALRKDLLARLDLVVFSSSAEERDSMSSDATARSVVIPHPVLEHPREIAPAKRVPGEPLAVGFLGRLHPKKNADLLIRAIAQVPTARLIIGGDGPAEYRHSLRELARTCGAEDRIEWRGFVKGAEKERLLDSLDVLAMPSAYESFGMSAAEALTRGVPTMVSPHCGIADIVQRYGCGEVVETDLDVWVAAIERFGSYPDLGSIQQASLLAARSELSAESFGATMSSEYERLVDQPKPPRVDRVSESTSA